MIPFPFHARVALLSTLFLAGCNADSNDSDGSRTVHGPEAAPSSIVQLDRHKVFHAGITTEFVQKQSLAVPLALPGRVSIDERRYADISAPVTGRIERTNAFTNDRVQEGAVLLELFSQEFLALQNEFLQTVERRSRDRNLPTDEVADALSIYESAKRKLLLLGLKVDDIAALESTRVPQTHFHIRAPFSGTIIETKARQGSYVQVGSALYELADLSTLWVLTDLYEKDLPFVKAGMTAQINVAADARPLPGVISTIYSVMDARTRTVKARVQVDNPRGILKPEMFCTVHVQTRMDSSTIKVPASALLGEPRKHYVFLALNDTTFERRDVLTGFEGRDVVEILDGLLVGERLVTKGGFFLKSELAKETFGEEH